MVNFRAAVRNDLGPLLDLIEAGFSYQKEQFNPEIGREHRILFDYLYSRSGWQPEQVYLAEENGQPLAAVGFFPKVLAFDELQIPVWAISPVVCHPDQRGRGYAGACLTQALEYIKQYGVTAVFLWGLPDYYPRFGFVPILPRYYTKLNYKVIPQTIKAKRNQGRLRSLAEKDLARVSAIYDSNKSWLQPQRGLEWWQRRYQEMGIELAGVKEVPFPEKDNFLVWENTSGEIAAYLYYFKSAGEKLITISEAISLDLESANEILHEFIRVQWDEDYTLKIRGTPISFLNMAAYRLGGMHINYAPRQGMVKIIDWTGFIKQLIPLLRGRIANQDLHADNSLRFDAELQSLQVRMASKNISLDISRNELALTRLIFGLYDPGDRVFLKDELPCLETIFPPKYPFVWDANYLY